MEQLQIDSQVASNQGLMKKNTRLVKFGSDCKRFIKAQPLGAISIAFILIVVLVAIFAPLIATHDPVEQNRDAFLTAPGGENLMGTDDLGRDLFSRIVFGSRISLVVGFASVFFSMAFGVFFGVVSGYFGGKIDMFLQRIMDAVMSIPALILALFIAALLGPSIRNVIIALVVIETPRFARIVRGEMLRIRETNYVEASRSIGSSVFRIIWKHAIPNMAAPLIVLASLTFGQAIIAEASLSFLGIGTPPPNPSWGLMLSDASRYMEIAPWLVLFPGLALGFCVLAFNLLGDALRDFFDPKLSS